MTQKEFKIWRKELMHLSQQKAADALGISKGSFENYENGYQRGNMRDAPVPKTVALACSALFHRLEPWGEKDNA